MTSDSWLVTNEQMHTFKTLSIGGATYDLFVRLPEGVTTDCTDTTSFALPLGGKIRVKEVVETCGGGASNTAVGFSRLGCSAHFEGVIASDQWGEKLQQNLQNEGVHLESVTIVEGEVSSFSIILSGNSGERVILYEPGTNAHLHDMTFDKDMLAKVDWVYLNHIQEDSCMIQDDIISMLTEEGSPRLTWNPGGCQIEKGLDLEMHRALLKNTDILIMNKEEALEFTKEHDIDNALKKLIDAGAANVCITNGSNGTHASDGHTVYHCPVVPDMEVIDTTGAGDAFGTGVSWGLLTGMTLSEALKTGTINAASVVGAIGAETALLTDTEIHNRLQKSSLNVQKK